MMNPRKDARPSHRYPAAAGSPSPPDRSSRSRRASLLAASVVLLLVAGWKWHDAALTAPVRVGGIDEPTALIVVQEGDCPDRRAALATWIAERASTAADERAPMRLAVLGRGAGIPEPELGALAALPPEHVPDAARALVRFGVEGTPALLLVDASGLPVLGASFATDGPGERLDFALRLLESASGGTSGDAPPAGIHTRTLEPSEGDGNRWNP